MGKATETLEFLINANAANAVKAFKDVGDAADTHLKKAKTHSEEVSANLTKFGAGAVAVAGIVGAGLIKMGADFDSAFDKIRVQTGATGATLKGLQGDFKATLSQVPSSMDEVSTAIGTLNQKLGLSGKPLQELSVQFLNLSKITGTDLKTNVESATGLFNQWGVSAEQQKGKLDELFQVTQASGIGFTALTDALSSNGAALKGVGLTFDEAAGFLGVLAKNGLDASTVIPALGKAMATAAKDGQSAQDVFRNTFEAIKAAPTDVAAAGIALDVFGAKAGPKFAQLVREGTLSYDDFAKALSSSGDTINKAAADTYDFGEKLAILRNKLEVAIEPAVSSAFDNLTTVVGLLGDAFDALPAPVTAALGNILLFGTAILGVTGGISLLVAKVGPLVGTLATAATNIAGVTGAVAGFGAAASIASPAVVAFGSSLALLAITNPEIGALIGLAAAIAYVGVTSHDSGSKVDEFNNDVKKLGGIDKYAEFLRGFGDASNYAGDATQKAAGVAANAAAIHQRFLDILKESPEAASQFKKAAEDAGISTEGWSTDITAAAVAVAKGQAANEGFTKSVDAAAASIPGSAAAIKVLTDAANAHADAVKNELKALSDLAATEQAQVDAQRAAADASIAVGAAEDKQTTFLAGLNKEIDDAGGNQQKLNDINREAVDTSQNLADAQNALQTQLATANGTTVTATQKLDTWNGSMLTSAANLSGPLQEAVLGHIAAVNGIPPEKLTDVQALINAGDIAGAEAELNKVSRARTVAIDADTKEAQAALQHIIDQMNSLHDKTIHVNAVGSTNVHGTEGAMGGPKSGMVLVGELGPELVSLPSGSYVYTNAQTRAMTGIPSFADGGIVGSATGGTGGAQRGSGSYTLHDLFGPTGRYGSGAASSNDPLRKLFGGGTDFANWKVNSGKYAGWTLIDLFGPGTDFYINGMTDAIHNAHGPLTGSEVLERFFGRGADFANYTTRDPNFKGTIHWTPLNSTPAPTFAATTPGQYAGYTGKGESAPYMGPLGTGDKLLDPALVAAINEAGNDQWGNVNLPKPAAAGFPGIGPNDYRAPTGLMMNVVINMPPGSNGDDVVRALVQYQRRNGAVPISVTG